MTENEYKLTDLDLATGSHRLQMMKAALPYMDIRRQRTMSLFIKFNEMMRTMEFFRDNEDGMMSVCSLDDSHVSAADMLEAVKAYANPREQELIDVISAIFKNRESRGRQPVPVEQLLPLLPPEQQSRFETLFMMMQTMNQM